MFSISDREVKKINEREVMKNIKDMPKHARPREKLREKGASALTDEELLAAILGTGEHRVEAVEKSLKRVIISPYQ